jgi:sugar lactone lactonase YvrE
MRTALLLVLLLACHGSAGSSHDATPGMDGAFDAEVDSGDGDVDAGVMPDAGTEDAAAPDASGPEIDCDAIPQGPFPFTRTSIFSSSEAEYGAEDFVFDREGYLVLVDRYTSTMFRLERRERPELVVGNLGTLSSAGTRILPNGKVVVADEGGPILLVGRDRSITPIATGYTSFNGLVVGIDGAIYGASYTYGVVRIDPETEQATVLYNVTSGGIDGITFSPDYRTLYFNEGEIYSAGEGRLLKGTLTSTGGLVDVQSVGRPLETTQGTLDGMTTDVCGNIYIAAQNISTDACTGSALVRVTPAGESSILTCMPEAFTPSLNFGSGRGDWDRNTVYVIDWFGFLYEVEVGVPGRREPHLE